MICASTYNSSVLRPQLGGLLSNWTVLARSGISMSGKFVAPGDGLEGRGEKPANSNGSTIRRLSAAKVLHIPK